jgi:hypothetical protein
VTRERTHYFAGLLLGADELAQEQLYFLDKARRHNRMLHGWGVVCGLEVKPGPGRLQVRVAPGYALDPNGNEIVIESEVAVDLCKEDRGGSVIPPCEPEDEASWDVVERSPGQHLYVAVRYSECYSHRVPALDSGSDEAAKYSRIRESFSITALPELPATHSTPNEPSQSSHRRLKPKQRNGPPSGESLIEPWVVLADITVGRRLDVDRIDSTSHRPSIHRDG